MFDEIANCYQPFDAIIETYVNLNLKGSRYIYLTYCGSFDKQILKRFVLNLSTNIKKKPKIKYSSDENNTNSYTKIQEDVARNMISALNWNYSYYLFGMISSNYHFADLRLINLESFGKLIDIIISKK